MGVQSEWFVGSNGNSFLDAAGYRYSVGHDRGVGYWVACNGTEIAWGFASKDSAMAEAERDAAKVSA